MAVRAPSTSTLGHRTAHDSPLSPIVKSSSFEETAEDVRHSQFGKETYEMRKRTVERVFADVKEKHGMRYTPYRGFDRVTNWVRLKFAAMNLKKLALWKWKASYPAHLFHLFFSFRLFSTSLDCKEPAFRCLKSRFFDGLEYILDMLENYD